MKRWKILLLAGLSVALSGFFLAIMRPPGGQSSMPGQDLPWQASIGQDGATLTVFGLTLGKSTVRDAVNKLGRRYELGLFQGRDGLLKLEAYFRDAVVGGLNTRLVLSAQLPEPILNAIQAHSGTGKPTADGSRRYPVVEADADLALGAVVTAITYLPVVKFDAELVRKRFGAPAEQIAAEDGSHWLYPALGLDLLLGDNGEALLQYVPPLEFEQRLRAPLRH
ncbi:MAG: hypothetical protein JNK95_15920 [Candidatus Competibacter sp.]|nr:hypothetical protein [Candidatus Competibacter sp.]MDG4607295.1 hypothetical protein [Candidatus Contendobacter sp.]HRD49284.1 hypothetical protein [Candidatus Contendobacter sp.]